MYQLPYTRYTIPYTHLLTTERYREKKRSETAIWFLQAEQEAGAMGDRPELDSFPWPGCPYTEG